MKKIDKVSVSGIYACDCGHLEAHINGVEKTPCAHCGSEEKWTLMVGTDELHKTLTSLYSYVCTKNLAEEIASRYEKR